jgi:hypothetical protein
MSDILIVHNTIKDFAVFDNTSRNLLNLGISFDIDFNVTVAILGVDSSNSLNCEVNEKVSPLGGEFSSNSTFDNFD